MADTLRRIRTRWVRQDDPGIKKEWYQSPGEDLLVRRERSAGGEIVGLELTLEDRCGPGQGYVRWARGRRLQTGRIDSGCHPGGHKMSPVASCHARPDPRILRAAAAFVRDPRRKLPPAIRDFVLERLREAGLDAPRARSADDD